MEHDKDKKPLQAVLEVGKAILHLAYFLPENAPDYMSDHKRDPLPDPELPEFWD